MPEARSRFRTALERAGQVLRPDHWRIADYQSNLGNCLLLLDEPQLALSLLQATAQDARQRLPDRPRRAGVYLTRYGRCLIRLGRLDEARPVLEEAHRILSEFVDADTPEMIEVFAALEASRTQPKP